MTLGVAGAIALLAVGASLATGGEVVGQGGLRAAAHHGKPRDFKPRNVILFIGDGMGTQEVTAARYYQGARRPMRLDAMRYTGFQTTWSIKPGPRAPYLPDYDPDSAATGTMWATGHKTLDGRISQGPSSALDVPGRNLPTVLELAQKAGMRTGNVSTAEITDATPAVLDSHISDRDCQGPADAAEACPHETKAAGGLGSIAEQTVDHGVDVLLGGGRDRFTQEIAGGRHDGLTVEQSARRQGYREITSADQLARLRRSRRPVLGLFAAGNMTTEWTGPTATLGDGTPAQRCEKSNRPADQPSLTAMTRKAIRLLDDGDRDGFFLQVEGASIDKQDHAANACGQIGETVALDRAIGVALAYQRTHPDTLVLVTADHSHTSEIVGEDTSGTGNPTGYSTNLITNDGQTMRMTYGTTGGNPAAATPPSQQHTGAVVPIWGSGPGAQAILGTTDHTDLFDVLR